MLEVFIMVSVVGWFSSTAKKKNRNGKLWGIIGAISFYVPLLLFSHLVYPNLIKGHVTSENLSTFTVGSVFFSILVGAYSCYIARLILLNKEGRGNLNPVINKTAQIKAKKVLLIHIFLVTILILGIACKLIMGTSFAEIRFHHFRIEGLSDGWSEIGKSDSMIGWLYKENGSSITIKVTENVEDRGVSDTENTAFIAEQYLGLNKQNELINSSLEEVFSTKFNSVRMKFINKKFGLTQLTYLLKRVNDKCYNVFISIPCDNEQVRINMLPEYITKMMDHIKYEKI